ncbi:MAG TPA: hybrid sensor histidine kinase/response regulator [Bdellovibrionales bacterium]|nr:hybrid sensor histidine kinase/response regulator [Bdellovibrionales bacterium]
MMKHNLLCVDDEPDNVDALERLFRKKYKVFKATSGASALEILEKENISLIISDQRMPQMTGVEFLAKSIEIQPDAIRILLTGYTDLDSVIAAINSGQIYRYVTKPWDPVDLTNAVDKALERLELSIELKEKNAALHKALAELQTLDRSKDEFMILINHELKTPLTVILSYLELLKESSPTEEQAKYLKRVGEASERLQKLIQDSLELVSADTGTLKKNITPFLIDEAIEQILISFSEALNKKGMKIKKDLSPLVVRSDSKLISGVLQRLIENAIQFGNPDSTLLISAKTRETETVVKIVNEGPDLSAEVIDRIMKPFNLNENALHHSKGSGLGLSVSQAILKNLGSELNLTSDRGKVEVSFVLG